LTGTIGDVYLWTDIIEMTRVEVIAEVIKLRLGDLAGGIDLLYEVSENGLNPKSVDSDLRFRGRATGCERSYRPRFYLG
jgi:hypothetical protein